MNRVGIVGLGLLGTTVASRLLQGSVEVAGYDVRAEQTHALASAGLCTADNTAGACEGADAVFTILPPSKASKKCFAVRPVCWKPRPRTRLSSR